MAKQIACEHNVHPVLVFALKSARREISDQLWTYEYSHDRRKINRRKLNNGNGVHVKITAVLKLDGQGNTVNKNKNKIDRPSPVRYNFVNK